MYPPLFERFDEITRLPIEIEEICEAIEALGFQDEIILQSSPHLDSAILRGLMFKQVVRNGVYAEPIFRAFVLYPENADLKSQRVICAKELIHVCDSDKLCVSTSEDLTTFVQDLLGPMVRNGVPTKSTIIATTDQLAEYQALDLLLPRKARELARDRVATGSSYQEVSELAMIPEKYVPQLLHPDWERLSALLRSMPR